MKFSSKQESIPVVHTDHHSGLGVGWGRYTLPCWIAYPTPWIPYPQIPYPWISYPLDTLPPPERTWNQRPRKNLGPDIP